MSDRVRVGEPRDLKLDALNKQPMGLNWLPAETGAIPYVVPTDARLAELTELAHKAYVRDANVEHMERMRRVVKAILKKLREEPR